jgi:hypothetical protein
VSSRLEVLVWMVEVLVWMVEVLVWMVEVLVWMVEVWGLNRSYPLATFSAW